MGYEIDYSGYTNTEEKMKAALRDAEAYLTEVQLNTLWDIAMNLEKYARWSFYAGFAGIQGPPRIAIWEDVKQTCKDMTQ